MRKGDCKGRVLRLAWLKDPLDVAFLHIQGSGRLRLPDGKDLSVHYQASNGRPYRSIGRYMIERGFLSREEMSMQAIRRYLTENPQVRDEVLNYNPSYVFFRRVENGPLGSLGVLLTPGRSVALDPGVFPKGALGFISSQKPLVNEGGRSRMDPILSFCLEPGLGRGDQRGGKGGSLLGKRFLRRGGRRPPST